MNTKKILIATVAIVAIVGGATTWRLTTKENKIVVVPEKQKTEAELELEHQRETWISALEWCESRGKNKAINPKDRDGTPSYSNFQWKPSTLLFFGQKYGLIATSTMLAGVPEILKNYDLQRNIVRHMIPDKTVDWYQQFPQCVKTKVGLPPIK